MFAVYPSIEAEGIMQRLEEAERRLTAAISRVETELKGAKAIRRDTQKGLELIGSIEMRAETAMQQLEQLIAQGREERRG
ncbi:MAG: hypothetical protein AAFX52_03625 [Pseudomonadota bacterium]